MEFHKGRNWDETKKELGIGSLVGRSDVGIRSEVGKRSRFGIWSGVRI